MTGNYQFCTFYLDHLLFGVELQKIQEVVTYRELRPVPLAPAVVSGLMNLRGQVIVALELRHLLELAPRPSNLLPICLGLQAEIAGDGQAALGHYRDYLAMPLNERVSESLDNDPVIDRFVAWRAAALGKNTP